MEIKAESKYTRITPRKLRLVADSIRELSLKEVLENLAFLPKRAANPLLKTIKSAVANASHNFKLKEEDLEIKSIEILKGPVLKRWKAVSRGRAHPFVRRTSHIKVILEESKKDAINKSLLPQRAG